jgi:predicted nuclease of predicted toxin-antitoxin system
MKLLVDMNLTPRWCAVLAHEGWEAVHWSDVGNPAAPDRDLMAWAADNGYVVLTHDLDFGSILATTRSSGPSVVQVRARDVLPAHFAAILIPVLRERERLLESGALIVVDESRSRVRILPLGG